MKITKSHVTVTAVAAIGATVMTVVAACSSTGKAAQPYLDSGQTGKVDRTNAITIANPDGFSNLTAKCVDHNGVYAAFHGDNPYASIFVLPNDPNCATGTYVDPNAR